MKIVRVVDGYKYPSMAGPNDIVMFTEFCPDLLKRTGFLPVAYLNELQRHGFKIHIIDERRQQLELV